MSVTDNVEQKVEKNVDEFEQEAKPWIIVLARLGYAAKGVVYALIGILVIQAALGFRSPNINPRDALVTLFKQPFGKVLLWLIAIGLVGYVVWRMAEAFLDPEHKGSDLKGIIRRVGFFISGVGYAALAYAAIQLALGNWYGGTGSSTEKLTGTVMGLPFGRWLIGLAGVVVVGIAISVFYIAYTKSFKKRLKLEELSDTMEAAITRLGQFGVAARGVVYAIIGAFLILAAWQQNPSKATGIGGALAAVAAQPYGVWLLWVMGAGLIAYGIFAVGVARYRRIYGK
jgi:hypothetical protein